MNRIVLCGNPNSGKTTIFNALTKSFARVGNYNGVTVDVKEKQIKIDNTLYTVVDLPGTYSLNYYTQEEKITTDYLKNLDDTDIIIYMADLSKLQRSLYFYFQLSEVGFNTILCLNKIDKIKVNLNYDLFDKYFQNNYFVFSPKTIKADIKAFLKVKNNSQMPPYFENKIKNINYSELNYSDRLDCIKTEENDENKLKNKIILRYNYLKNILKNSQYSVTDCQNKKVEKALFNTFTGLIIMTIIFILIFLFVFFFSQKIFVNLTKNIFNYFSGILQNFCLAHFHSKFIQKFIIQCIFSSTAIILTFFPQLFTLFVCISILEESGYLTRLCFITDDYLSKIGLSGKAIFTLFVCFGCCTSACYQSRATRNKGAKTGLALSTSYMICSAKIPCYLIFCNLFLSPLLSTGAILFIYLFSIAITFFVLYSVNKILSDGTESELLFEEVPTLKIPHLRNIFFSSIRQTIDFLVKTGSIILFCNMVVWILINCDFTLNMVDNIEKSILYIISNKLTFIFYPLGFGTPPYVASLFSGVMAKEMIVSTLSMFSDSYNSALSQVILNQNTMLYLTFESSISFVLFLTFYCPCISNFLVIAQETKLKYALISILFQFVFAYILAFLTYNLLLQIKVGNYTILIFFAIILVLFEIFRSIKKVRQAKN